MPEIRDFPETHVAYVSEKGAYREAIPRGFKRLFDWLNAKGTWPFGPSMGIFYDDPSKVPPEKQRCDLCAPVASDVTGSGEVRTKEIGGWKVATVIYEGEENEMAAYNEVYEWLHREGYHELDAPIQVYLSSLGERLRAEIAVPIVKQEITSGKGENQAKGPRKTTRKAATKTTKRSTTRKSSKTSEI